jgi:hypothetical protein
MRSEVAREIIARRGPGVPRAQGGYTLFPEHNEQIVCWREFFTRCDVAHARYLAKRSLDDGQSWQYLTDFPGLIYQPAGEYRTQSIEDLERLADGAWGRVSFVSRPGWNAKCYFQRSDDEMKTWSEESVITPRQAYNCPSSNQLRQVSDGRLVYPYCFQPSSKVDNADENIVATCAYSDDGGESWQSSETTIRLPGRGAMEPTLEELRDGRLLMFIRNQTGTIQQAMSSDRGRTWSEAESTGIRCSESGCYLKRISSTGDLLLAWNDRYDPAGFEHYGRRTPLCTMISRDEGRTWENQRWLENDPWRTFGNASITFHQDKAYFNYYVGHGVDYVGNWDGCRTIVPIAWLYEPPAPDEPFQEPGAEETKTFYDHLEQAQKTEIVMRRQRSSAAIFSIRNPLDIPLRGEIEWGDIYWQYMPPEPEVFSFELGAKGTVEVTTDLDSKLIRPMYALRLYDLQGREVLFRMDLLR